MTKAGPVIVIIVAIVAAGGIAVYMSQGNSESADATPAPVPAPAPGAGRVRGNPEAPVTLVEFGDYECPSCGYYHPVVMELMRRYPSEMKLQFHHFPLIQIHPNAMAASLAAEAAGDQGKFWEMHDLLFENQRSWERRHNVEGYFLSLANQIGLNGAEFQQAFKAVETRDRVLADVRMGVDSNVQGTPTFYINGQLVPNDPPPGVEDLARLIESSLKTAAKQ
jgi:protein-disulfide isomerase